MSAFQMYTEVMEEAKITIKGQDLGSGNINMLIHQHHLSGQIYMHTGFYGRCMEGKYYT